MYINTLIVNVFVTVVILLLYLFNNSLENVQYYHNRLMDYPWVFEQMGLKYCSLASSLRKNPQIGLYVRYIPEITSNIKLVQGYNNRYNLETYGIAFMVKGELNVAFISTSNLDDVYTSLCSKSKDIYLGNVHSGYYNHLHRGIYSSLLWIIQESPTFKKIKLMGHSMGGVMASLAAVSLWTDLGIIAEVLTYGSPRWGDKQLKSSLGKTIPITNYINVADPVPKRPVGYVPIGKSKYFRIDTSNDNVNHGIRVYREIVTHNGNHGIKKRGHRYDEAVSSMILNLFQ